MPNTDRTIDSNSTLPPCNDLTRPARAAVANPNNAGACPTRFNLTDGPERWPVHKAWDWLEQRGWLLGCNYIPSTAINQLEMWQTDTFDTATIDWELGLAASLGFNSIRVYLHDLLWKQDSKGLLARMHTFLAIADRHGIGVMFVLFDSCWHPVPKLGAQAQAIPGTHNSGWVQSPGAQPLLHPERYPHLQEYVFGVVRHFADDSRVQLWDVWNEPNNFDGGSLRRPGLEPPDKRALVRTLLPRAFAWARAALPSQPLTSGLWDGKWADLRRLSQMERIQLAHSDIISFHNYRAIEHLAECVSNLRRLGRPLICTEYLARTAGSSFEPNLGYLKDQDVSAYCWGFVSGKTQTIYPNDSWITPYGSEPSLWFHDIFRPDGSPYRSDEIHYIRRLTGRSATP